jgi:hypothetical protein
MSLRSPSHDGGTDHHAVDADLVHFGQKLVLAERRAMRLGPFGPRPFRRIGRPDVNLCIDDLRFRLLP